MPWRCDQLSMVSGRLPYANSEREAVPSQTGQRRGRATSRVLSNRCRLGAGRGRTLTPRSLAIPRSLKSRGRDCRPNALLSGLRLR